MNINVIRIDINTNMYIYIDMRYMHNICILHALYTHYLSIIYALYVLYA